MSNGIIKRLECLEARFKKYPLIVLARLGTGEEVKISMREYLDTPEADFIKVVAGNSIEDLDLFLKANAQKAMNEQNERTKT